MIDNNCLYHILEETDGQFVVKLSFKSFDEALEFLKFAPAKNLVIVSSEELDDYLDDNDLYN